jgi:para-aminobenzoate synthetase/4-amino-4-deoxychorismate lyase
MTAMSDPGASTAVSAARAATGVRVVVRDPGASRWLWFESPRRMLVARTPDEVVPMLRDAGRAVEGEGLHMAGFVSYEAAPAFDAHLAVRPDGAFPLLWFGLFDPPRELAELPRDESHALDGVAWQPSIGPERYRAVFSALRRYIRDGDTYQVNFTHRLRARIEADPWAAFLALLGGDAPPPFAAFVDTGEWALASASPELFFRLDAATIESRPMKGTAARGLWPEDDARRAAALRASHKDRAENVMIVDMVRNDLGRVARTGSVAVPALFTVERYPTVWQMTSTVRARTQAPLEGIFGGLFPPASIVGVPKRRAMEIISELEDGPRRAYTGAIGYAAPGRRAQFNVAIRTVVIERATRQAEYGVGGGIVWDSDCEAELEECRIKARVLRVRRPPFELLETLLWTPGEGYALLSYHLDRLARSADYFGFAQSPARVTAELERVASRLPAVAHRVRLLADSGGGVRCEALAIGAGPHRFSDVALAAEPVDRGDVFLYHKTTQRAAYDRALRAAPGFDDVLLYNEAGEVTETTLANVAIEKDGVLLTPPVRCGLLAGTYRAWMLDERRLLEQVLSIDEVLGSDAVYLMNSVRGMHRIRVFDRGREAVSGDRVPAARIQ